ncbi:ubiquitin-protein ligase [Suhomyces tanzawaensis NRRL Y-17324]|uniref:E3 ubiquitin-protein ligase n=1 Tax=Suhomyces tanzawaensis NRRL Y-17324 TaxID=984487 RepID=A0A1E4SFW7_9ASCO|nr:ubiquitin-protein ligase [Suhomyces tanzawaensis NRRL Y-17324]ODV78408.1 ubiquitin-protein ligase [Suhomyces tanzawaensis NRRL Y-17324]
MSTSDADTPAQRLKRFLFLLPKTSEFDFSNNVKKELRKQLFLSSTNEGQYLDWLFPKIFKENSPKDQLFESIDEKLEWKFSEYYKYSIKDAAHQVHNHHAFHPNLACARIFRKGEPIYRCLTCGFDETCALCSDCYDPEVHKGHKVHIIICLRENGGVCDCGDPEAWLNDFDCFYRPQDQESRDNSDKLGLALPPGFADSFMRTMEIILDFVIDVLSHSDLQYEDPNETTTTKIEKNSINSTLDPQKYGFNLNETIDSTSDKFFLMVYNDQIRHYRDAVQRIHLVSRKVKQFAIMVTNKVQSYGKAKVISSKNLNLLIERQKLLSSTGLASCIRNHRDIFREDMCDEILRWLSEFTESELFKINNDIKNLFCQAFCSKWNAGLLRLKNLNDDYEYKVGTLDNLRIPKVTSKKTTSPTPSHWLFTPSKWDLPEDICNKCQYNLNIDEYDTLKSHFGSRFQYLVYFDVRFWKSIRAILHDMYSTSLITNLEYKYIISCQYVDIYPTIANMFLLMDREPEINVMCTLSTQLFTCPSNSTSIVQHGDLSRIFATIYGFLTTEEIKTPDTIQITNQILMKSLKNRRWGQIFFDVGYILSRSRDSSFILTSGIIPMSCDILSLFQGKPAIKREKESHIEFENSDYTSFFHAILVIYQFGESISQCLSNLKDFEVKKSLSKNAIIYVIRYLLQLEKLGMLEDSGTRDLDSDSSQRLEDSEILGSISTNPENRDSKVSFLHPLHSFLSWLIEVSNFDNLGQLAEVLDYATSSEFPRSGVIQSGELPNPLTTIFDYPIRTIVLMSQIKSGFWVRNGFSIRNQLQLYRNSGLRENGYMRDLFMTQVFINSNSPNLTCFLIFSRWLLMDGWITEKTKSLENACPYDAKTLPYIVEECINFFINILTEHLYLQGFKEMKIKEIRIKNEILHNLCFEPMNYTKLCSQIPDHITSDKRFDLILEEVTTFKAPQTANDIGIYQLKDEYVEQINPYYFNYSTNTKDDAIKFIKDQIHKTTKRPMNDIVIEPKKVQIQNLGIYRYIGNFSVSAYFSDFIIRTLRFVIREGLDALENLLETLLHLIHLCSLEQLIDSNRYGSFYDRFVNISDHYGCSVAFLLYQILLDEKFKSHHAKVRAIYRVFEEKYQNLADILNDQVVGFDCMLLDFNASTTKDLIEEENKKRLVQERKKKLMAKFKKQQSLFMKNFKCESDIEMEDNERDKGEGTYLNSSEDDGDQELWKFPEPHCILCQNTSEDSGPFGIISYISKSSEFRTVPFDDRYWFLKAFSDGPNLDNNEDELEVAMDTDHHNCQAHHEATCGTRGDHMVTTANYETFMTNIKQNNVIGPGFKSRGNVDSKLVSLSCGHGMHFQCYMNFLISNKNKLNQITRNAPENIDHKEFLCPLCKSINNMFIPIMWSYNNRKLEDFLSPTIDNRGQGVLNPFEFLSSDQIYNREWYQEFTNAADNDIEALSIVSPSSKEMIAPNPASELTLVQQQFRILLSNMFQTISFFSFPQVLKADSTYFLTNTIKSVEISLRGVSSKSSLIINQLSNNSLTNMRILCEFRNTSVLMKIKDWIHLPIRKGDAYTKMLSTLFSLAKGTMSDTILEGDFFEILVNSLPIKSMGFSFNAILSTCFMGHILQVFNTLVGELSGHNYYMSEDFSVYDVPIISGLSKEIKQNILELFSRFTNGDATSIPNNERLGDVLSSMLIKACTPFLRRAAILLVVLCAKFDLSEYENFRIEELEADRLCSFLNLNSISQYLSKFVNLDDSTTYEYSTLSDFLIHIKTRSSSADQLEMRKQLEYPGIIKLVALPERLDLFFSNYYYSDMYNSPHVTIEDPAICLFCAEVVDAQKAAIGCEEGQCTTHFLRECANEIGIFLLAKDRSLLLLHKNGGSFQHAPFLDHHGELPGETRKSKPLYLMKLRYDDFIRNFWLQHNIPNFIARSLDGVLDGGGWDTL